MSQCILPGTLLGRSIGCTYELAAPGGGGGGGGAAMGLAVGAAGGRMARASLENKEPSAFAAVIASASSDGVKRRM